MPPLVNCPSCKCFKITAPRIEGGNYTYKYGICVDGQRQYAEGGILGNQVLYVCGIENTFVLPVGATIQPLAAVNGLSCIGVEAAGDGCIIPEAHCYTVSLATGISATFQYIVPVDNNGHNNMIITEGVSSMLSPTKKICARAGSIVQTGGTGTISISAPGIYCTTTPLCEATCDCVTLINQNPDEVDIIYSYVGCDGIPVNNSVLTFTENIISFCMLTDTFSTTDNANVYTLYTNGDCPSDGSCSCDAYCVMVQYFEDGGGVGIDVLYTDCTDNQVSSPFVRPTPSSYGIVNICTNSLAGITSNGGLGPNYGFEYAIVGACSDNLCSKDNCNCYYIIDYRENPTVQIVLVYLPCDYDVNNPQLTHTQISVSTKVTKVCAIGIPAVYLFNTEQTNTTIPFVEVVKNEIGCTGTTCNQGTAYCYQVSCSGGDVDFGYLDHNEVYHSIGLNDGDPPISVCAIENTIGQVSGSGTLNIGPKGSVCTGSC